MVVSGWSISGWLRVGSLTVRPESEIPCVAVPLGWCSVCGMVTVRDPLSDSPFGQVRMLVSGETPPVGMAHGGVVHCRGRVTIRELAVWLSGILAWCREVSR